MIDLFANNADKIFTILTLITLSTIMRQVLVFAGQNWIATFSHTATIITLPIITYVITSVISGNIALSLGMVGALSIVRFRNPVKSPFELSAYFMSITMGIAASVSMKWLLLLCASIMSALALIYAINFLMKLLTKKPWFSYSFSEGNRMSTINITSKKALDDLLNHENLISVFQGSDGYEYCLASHNTAGLIEVYNKLSENPDISSIKLLK